MVEVRSAACSVAWAPIVMLYLRRFPRKRFRNVFLALSRHFQWGHQGLSSILRLFSSNVSMLRRLRLLRDSGDPFFHRLNQLSKTGLLHGEMTAFLQHNDVPRGRHLPQSFNA